MSEAGMLPTISNILKLNSNLLAKEEEILSRKISLMR
jgi:hypothetical protein